MIGLAKQFVGYSNHGRQNTVTDARNGTTTYWFNDADQIKPCVSPQVFYGSRRKARRAFGSEAFRTM